jgi:hypothetical protein
MVCLTDAVPAKIGRRIIGQMVASFVLTVNTNGVERRSDSLEPELCGIAGVRVCEVKFDQGYELFRRQSYWRTRKAKAST